MTQMLRIFVLLLCALAALYLYLGSEWGGLPSSGFELSRPPVRGALDLAPDSNRRRIDPLEQSDEAMLARQRSKVDELARRYVGSPITGGQLGDLRTLQDLLDQRVLAPDQTYELQAMGVVLGDVMVAQLGFRWVVVEDDLGRSRALRLGESEELIFPVTMISKRVEGDIRFDVNDLYTTAQRLAAGQRTTPY